MQRVTAERHSPTRGGHLIPTVFKSVQINARGNIIYGRLFHLNQKRNIIHLRLIDSLTDEFFK